MPESLTNFAHSIAGWASGLPLPAMSAGVFAILFVAAMVVIWALRHIRYLQHRKEHPDYQEFLRSSQLQHDIDIGLVGRGRGAPPDTPQGKKPPFWRAPWLELCLRVRALRAAAGGLFTMGGEVCPTGRLYIRHKKADGSVDDHGLVSTKVVTDAGVAFIVDAFQNTAEVELLKFHGIGTSNTAENQTDTTLGTEVESRATGTTTEGASANIYRTVGTVTTVSARAVVEHGIFSASSGGTLLDRSVFAVINTGAGDSIEFTYELTLPAGS